MNEFAASGAGITDGLEARANVLARQRREMPYQCWPLGGPVELLDQCTRQREREIKAANPRAGLGEPRGEGVEIMEALQLLQMEGIVVELAGGDGDAFGFAWRRGEIHAVQ